MRITIVPWLAATLIVLQTLCPYASGASIMPEFSRIAFLAPTGSSGDDEWVRVPSAICGINDTAEASGVFTIKYAWNEKTLRLKLVVFRRQPSTPATLHVFLDTRNIASARMDEYERGVAHFFFPLLAQVVRLEVHQYVRQIHEVLE